MPKKSLHALTSKFIKPYLGGGKNLQRVKLQFNFTIMARLKDVFSYSYSYMWKCNGFQTGYLSKQKTYFEEKRKIFFNKSVRRGTDLKNGWLPRKSVELHVCKIWRLFIPIATDFNFKLLYPVFTLYILLLKRMSIYTVLLMFKPFDMFTQRKNKMDFIHWITL